MLEGAEARHLSQVLRVGNGESITVFDGCGRRATAQVLSVTRNRVALELGTPQYLPAPLPAIALAQAIPKGKNMDLIIQKAVELGVAAIQPLVTRHSVVQPGDGKSDKWRRIALEACKQCGQDTLPAIADPQSFDSWMSACTPAPGLKLIASLTSGARPLREVLHAAPGTRAVTMLVGPEGDFSLEESRDAVAAGFLPVSLGSIVLRVATAALFCLAALRYEFSAASS